MITIADVKGKGDIALVAGLAKTIWTRHYVPIIGKAQVDYMLERFQSEEAIATQIAQDGYRYFLARLDDAPAGYLALVPQSDGSCLLSKLYVLDSARGRGAGRTMVRFAADTARAAGATELWLTVNRHNTGSIDFYERVGFANTGPVRADIGAGFVMDDFRMSLRLE